MRQNRRPAGPHDAAGRVDREFGTGFDRRIGGMLDEMEESAMRVFDP
ncbi:hypothetical protein M9978_11085 [Sphingomonas sp. MG17]|uniref:Uncharacterized protein n=1 Tax=Sphingomonas tagetis TaxID=2949092 RepID=A0A9X2KLM9_9SPHN|nr:hypothetical protein [Sphingomonas tagetis]MCP3730975.1 hypothetical protein [Sphingomonas tagetis]